MNFPVRVKPSQSPMRRGRLPAASCRQPRVDGPERPSGRNAYPHSGITPSTIMSPARHTAGSWTEIRLGARAHHTTPRPNRAHSPPKNQAVQPSNPEPHLTSEACTDKEHQPARWCTFRLLKPAHFSVPVDTRRRSASRTPVSEPESAIAHRDLLAEQNALADDVILLRSDDIRRTRRSVASSQAQPRVSPGASEGEWGRAARPLRVH